MNFVEIHSIQRLKIYRIIENLQLNDDKNFAFQFVIFSVSQ